MAAPAESHHKPVAPDRAEFVDNTLLIAEEKEEVPSRIKS
jgi:hypothetical protein